MISDLKIMLRCFARGSYINKRFNIDIPSLLSTRIFPRSFHQSFSKFENDRKVHVKNNTNFSHSKKPSYIDTHSSETEHQKSSLQSLETNNNKSGNEIGNDLLDDQSTTKKKKMDVFQLVNSIKPGVKQRLDKDILKDPKAPEWLKQKIALKKKFGEEGWNPQKKLSRDDMRSIKYLKTENSTLTTSQLGDFFKVSPEAIRRILKSKWEPNSTKEEEKLQERWKKRGEKIKQLYNRSTPIFQNLQNNEISFIAEEDKSKIFRKKLKTRKQKKLLKRTQKKPISFIQF